jgi:uncharacterized protein (DUF697 family)
MHNIDRTLSEFDNEINAYENEMNTYEREMDAYEADQEFEFEFGDNEYVLNEAEEMELAAELLEVADEYELDQFLGKLFRRVGKGIRRIVKSPVARALGGALKGVAKKALPGLGAAIGTAIAPGIGTKIGGMLGSATSNLFELELEGLSPEDQEFEVARRFVQLAGAAAKNAATISQAASPQSAAKTALTAAARKHAPGLLRPSMTANPANIPSGSVHSGRWIRRGRKIVLLGV